MTYIARSFDLDRIGPAWSFVLECEDEEPRGFGVDQLPAFPTRRFGVFRQRSHADATIPSYDEEARMTEDTLIARLDGELSDPDEIESLDDDRAMTDAFEADDAREPAEPIVDASDAGEPADPVETLPMFEGLGHRARHAPQVSLRYA